MLSISRRRFFALPGIAIATQSISQEVEPYSDPQLMDQWVKSAHFGTRAPVGELLLFRFSDPVYVLAKQIEWRPDAQHKGKHEPIVIPRGFVTDFASIPRVFWSGLRPDGSYTYPAIAHDFLYWEQTRTRAVADAIFEIMMDEFSIDWAIRKAIYGAVRNFGRGAWDSNAVLKKSGQRRVLSRMPTDPRTSWESWRKVEVNFN